MAQVRLQNWKREVTYHAYSLEYARSVADIVRIVKDRGKYPGPVRVKGSHHSTTRCVVNEGGTVIDMTQMNKILGIDRVAMTITMQAGVLHIDAAKALEREGLQFYVNVEIGNMTVGSGACGGTKDASFFSAAEGWEFGQVASYAIGIKAVDAGGDLIEVTEADGDLMAAMRSSYGMLGVIYEVTFRVKEIAPMAVEHIRYSVDEFADNLDDLVAGDRSIMLYLFPFLDRVMVEYRSEGTPPVRANAWQWRLRNFVWSKLGPGFSKIVTGYVPFRRLRGFLLNMMNRLTLLMAAKLLRGASTSPADQIIRYPDVGGFSAYTFSIWAFPRAEYPDTLRAYFRFCRDYYAETGFRCDLLNVGYHIAEDRQSLFSYTRKSAALTLDPVSTGGPGWEDYLVAYDAFCSRHNGTPLFNQTPAITPAQAQRAFGPEIGQFMALRQTHDPGGRFLVPFFRNLFEGT
ncbi:MAG: L-gulonolactone oxidase [Paracoccaceae bacterium]|jgi:L-gulonolactone oxidase